MRVNGVNEEKMRNGAEQAENANLQVTWLVFGRNTGNGGKHGSSAGENKGEEGAARERVRERMRPRVHEAS